MNQATEDLLRIASTRDHRKVPELIRAGADVRHHDARYGGITALHWVAQTGRCVTAERLIRAGADVNALTDNGCTPLSYAWAEPWPKMVATLLEAGASWRIANDEGITPLHLAAWHPYPEAKVIAKMLLAARADVNARSHKYGFTPLHGVDNSRMVKILFAAGARMDIVDNKGRTPLAYAIEDDELDVASALRKCGATM